MANQDLEELRQLISLQSEVSRQRLRTAAAEAFVDDYAQKCGINQAVYAAGYGIAPLPKRQPEESKASATVSMTAPQPAQPQPAAAPQPSGLSSALPWLLGAAIGLGGAGAVAAWPSKPAEQPKVEAPAPVEMPRYDVEKWRPK